VGDSVKLVKRSSKRGALSTIDIKAVAGRLRFLRFSQGESQSAVAGKLGVATTTYADWELGLRLPTVEALVVLLNDSHVDMDWLISGETDEPEKSIFFNDIWQTVDRIEALSNEAKTKLDEAEKRALVETILSKPPSQQAALYEGFKRGLASGNSKLL
jgi:transcriptional regulator with XRE-family HTH domain